MPKLFGIHSCWLGKSPNHSSGSIFQQYQKKGKKGKKNNKKLKKTKKIYKIIRKYKKIKKTDKNQKKQINKNCLKSGNYLEKGKKRNKNNHKQ